MNIEKVREEIRKRALLLVVDNPARAGDLHFIETAMLVGASIVLEQPIDDDDDELQFTPEAEELLRQVFEGPMPDYDQIRQTYLETVERVNRLSPTYLTPVVPRP
jgi:hypothetical protein